LEAHPTVTSSTAHKRPLTIEATTRGCLIASRALFTNSDKLEMEAEDGMTGDLKIEKSAFSILQIDLISNL